MLTLSLSETYTKPDKSLLSYRESPSYMAQNPHLDSQGYAVLPPGHGIAQHATIAPINIASALNLSNIKTMLTEVPQETELCDHCDIV